MSKPQVRLDPDVAEALRRAASRTAQEAELWLASRRGW